MGFTFNIIRARKCNRRHKLYRGNGSTYTCDGCKTSGSGPTYKCNKCNYNLHKECMNAKSKITPKIFPGYKFNFLKRPPSEIPRSCDACGMPVIGFVYRCKKTNWVLHPRCALLDKEIKADDVKFKLTKDVKSPCSECNNIVLDGAKDEVPGWCYVSDDDTGKFKFHVFCLMQMGMGMNNSCEGSSSSKDCGGGGALGNELEKIEQEDELKKRKRGGGQEEVEKGIQGNDPKKRKGSGRCVVYMKIFKIVLTTVLSILIGDPTTSIANLAVQLLT